MPRKIFRRQLVVSSLLTVIAVVAIVVFCIAMFNKYTPPNEDNTSLVAGTVTDVYYGAPRGGVTVVMSNGDSLRFVYPTGDWELYSAIGYDLDELADLLEGKSIEYRRMDCLPWVVEIYADDIKIDNTELTTKQMETTWVGIVVVGLIGFALAISGDVVYLISKYKCYRKAIKKQERKAKRELRKAKIIDNK